MSLNSREQSWQGQRKEKTLSDKGERLLGVKSQRIIPGHNESYSSQKPSLQDPTLARVCMWTPGEGPEANYPRRGQSKVIGLREVKTQETSPALRI